MEYLGPGAEDVRPEDAAGILVERLKNAGHLGDRRDALDALLSLSETHPQEVGHAGMPTFADILQAGIADGGMTRTIMEIMLNLVTERDERGKGRQEISETAAAPVAPAPDGGGRHGAEMVTAANIAVFLDDVQNVQNLLDLLESQDTLTAMSAVQASRVWVPYD